MMKSQNDYIKESQPVQQVQEEASPGGAATMEDNRESTVFQRKTQAVMRSASSKADNPIQRKANKTDLPDNLKSGIENLSGYSMDDVKVHFNSSKPAQLQAHAYAQGTDIHLAPGQEKHLPHEAWHVVQQKQGRVKPTRQLKSKVAINDDAGLEKEADVMGERAQLSQTFSSPTLQDNKQTVANHTLFSNNVHQLKVEKAPEDTVNSLAELKKLLNKEEIDFKEWWQSDLVAKIWEAYGFSDAKKNITVNEITKRIKIKKDRATSAFNHFKKGEYFTNELKRNQRVQNELKYNKDHTANDMQWLEQIMTEMSTRLLGMLDQLIVSFYFNRKHENIITKVGELKSLKMREDEAKIAGKDIDRKTTVADLYLQNEDYVFGFIEHKDLMPNLTTRFASPATKNGFVTIGDNKEGARISRPLRWYLNQPGVLIQAGDLLQQPSREEKRKIPKNAYPRKIIGVTETSESVNLKSYTPKYKQDKAELMIIDLLEHIKMKLWLQVHADGDNTKRDERIAIIEKDHTNISSIKEDATYLNALLRKYSPAQVLYPRAVKHVEGPSRKDRFSDIYDYDKETLRKDAKKLYKERLRKISTDTLKDWPVGEAGTYAAPITEEVEDDGMFMPPEMPPPMPIFYDDDDDDIMMPPF
ncbi:eCIS core domain-containing protein [Fulvivirga sediminis]|uniref:DUF4157 domain-containing protein n=1 Tax=Fulvivirga sediminis TaxID=2803949 RepID=A0A937F6H4_9BACT|nr:DUF4157 domain-containing protein [Fulvivirga sediminis]MBL3655529.1 DUF4157 domain-containing protein [Fulvivirga sediminis]